MAPVDMQGRAGGRSSRSSSEYDDPSLVQSRSSAQIGRQLPRINTGSLLSPEPRNNDQGGEPRCPSPVTPTVREHDPAGNTRILHRDGDTESTRRWHNDFYEQGRERSGSQSSFASIKTIEDLGFTNQVAANKANGPVSLATSLSPTAVGHGRTDSNSGLMHQNLNGDTLQEQLSELLRKHCQTSKAPLCHDKDFLPISEIEWIVSIETVRQVLAEELPGLSEEKREQLSKDICGDRPRRRVFALLLLGEQTKCIQCFVNCDVDDTDLPFVGVKAESNLWIYSRKDTTKKLQCFDAWRRKDLEWLLSRQHVVAPPFFDLSPGQLLLYDLPEDSVLPFTEYEMLGEGGYATVFKVLIHPAHHNCPGQGGPGTRYFAIKTLNSQNRAEYEKEVEVLQRFSGKNAGHPHLIRLLLTYMYKHKGSYHMVFPWADGGNLRDLWESMEPEQTQSFVCWMLSQYHGIAEGLREIHGTNQALNPDGRNKGRHGDIKAENILWVKNHNGKPNHLLISDFGLTRFHSFKSQSAEVNVPGCSPSYRPPECDLPRVRISPQYDMWTLGCLLLEFLTWYLLGWDTVETEFSDARMKDEGWTPISPQLAKAKRDDWIREDKFFTQSRDKDGVHEVLQLKESVIKWIDKLHHLPHCPGFAHDVLKIIHQGLLHPDKTKRWSSSKVVGELHRIWQRCESSDSYSLGPQAWEGGPAEVFRVRYNIGHIESLNEVIQSSCQQTEAPSPGSLSPVSGGASRASTPPPEHGMQAEGQPRTDPLGALVSAALKDMGDVEDALEEEPLPGQPPTIPPTDSLPGTQTQGPDMSTNQQGSTGSLHSTPDMASETERSLAAEGLPSATGTGLSSTPMMRSENRQARTARPVAERKRWTEFKQCARKICRCCFR